MGPEQECTHYVLRTYMEETRGKSKERMAGIQRGELGALASSWNEREIPGSKELRRLNKATASGAPTTQSPTLASCFAYPRLPAAVVPVRHLDRAYHQGDLA